MFVIILAAVALWTCPGVDGDVVILTQNDLSVLEVLMKNMFAETITTSSLQKTDDKAANHQLADGTNIPGENLDKDTSKDFTSEETEHSKNLIRSSLNKLSLLRFLRRGR